MAAILFYSLYQDGWSMVCGYSLFNAITYENVFIGKYGSKTYLPMETILLLLLEKGTIQGPIKQIYLRTESLDTNNTVLRPVRNILFLPCR